MLEKKVCFGIADGEYMQALKVTIISIINGDMNDEIEQLDIKKIRIQDFNFQEETSFVTIMKTWKLFIQTPTPDFKAIKRFMVERYKMFGIDAPHAPLFSK